MLTDQNWALSVGVFLPLAGVLIMMFIPKSDEVMVKAVGLLAAIATLVVGIVTLTQFDYGQADKLQFVADTKWIDVIHSRYIVGLEIGRAHV